MKANHRELLGLSFNGRLRNYFNNDFVYHDYNVGDLIMVEDLGYEWKETKEYVEYTKYYFKHWLFKSKVIIRFYKSPIDSFDIFDEFGISIHQDLLQAINKQVEELGWK